MYIVRFLALFALLTAQPSCGTVDDGGDDQGDSDNPDGPPQCETEGPDQDGDTYCDAEDECPTEPGYGNSLLGRGCPEPDLPNDVDEDGIIDEVDQCVIDAEDVDGCQDEDGCPEPEDACSPGDTDGDGIPDPVDGCVTESEDVDGCQDEDGCPEPEGVCPLACDTVELLTNGFFDQGPNIAWTPARVIIAEGQNHVSEAPSPAYLAFLYDPRFTDQDGAYDELFQEVTLPAGARRSRFVFWVGQDGPLPDPVDERDILRIRLYDLVGNLIGQAYQRVSLGGWTGFEEVEVLVLFSVPQEQRVRVEIRAYERGLEGSFTEWYLDSFSFTAEVGDGCP